MSRTTRVSFLAGATALTLTGVSYGGPASDSTNDELAQRLAAAEAKIASLESTNNQSWLTEQRASEIRGLVQDVLADADTRSSLLQSGMTAGYDNGFVLADPTGNWLLRTNFLMQQRFIYNIQDDGDTGAVDTNRYGFENTRSKFMMSGNVVNPDWYYLVDVNIGSNGSGRVGTGNAYIGHKCNDNFSIQVGSMKAPFLREELVDAQYQLAVERSNVNYIFTGGFVDGVQGAFNVTDQLHIKGMLSDGIGTGQTIWSAYDTEFAMTTRAEFLFSGTWKQFNDFTSQKDGESGILVGGALHYQQGEFGTAADEIATTAFTCDASFEFGGGVNLFASFVWADVSANTGALDINPMGLVLQGGFYLAPEWEVFGRYEFADFDTSGVEDLSIFTLGVNRYFASHNAKWTTDLGFGLDVVSASSDITGWRDDVADEDGQMVLRTQWQILF